jgi:hypothetical protein
VIQSWIHTNQTTKGSTAGKEMRFNLSLSAGLCGNFENSDYQPKAVGLDRTVRKI